MALLSSILTMAYTWIIGRQQTVETFPIRNHQVCYILYTIILHISMHHQPLDLSQEVFAFFIEQFLVNFSLSISDVIGVIHGWVVRVTNKFDTFLEIGQEAGVVQ